jgi:carboxyl-terminal processing protease
VDLDDGYVLKFTTDYFLTPNLRLLNKIGVTPDIAAEDQKALAVAERSVTDQQLMNDNYRYLLTVDIEDLTAYINAKKQFDGESLVRNDHLYLKIRDVASEVGLSVWWDENTQQVMVQKEGQPAELVIDNSRAFIEDGKTYVSLWELARIIGGYVDYQSPSNIAWLQWN